MKKIIYTIQDLKLEFKKETGNYADDNIDEYFSWVEQRLISSMNSKSCKCCDDVR